MFATVGPVIADEPASVKSLYTGYIMILAAIPAVFGFIKGSLIGHSAFGVSVTTSIMAGLFGMVVSYILGLVMLYVIALIINALAPTFGGQKNQLQALKVANADRSQRVDLQLTDAPATSGLMAMANAFGGGGESESQSADGYEKTYTLDGQRIHEQWNN